MFAHLSLPEAVWLLSPLSPGPQRTHHRCQPNHEPPSLDKTPSSLPLGTVRFHGKTGPLHMPGFCLQPSPQGAALGTLTETPWSSCAAWPPPTEGFLGYLAQQGFTPLWCSASSLSHVPGPWLQLIQAHA